MGIETVVAGAYVGTYDSVNVGFTRRGYKTSRQNHQELVNESDLYGDTIIDTVYRGGDTFIDFISRVYKAGSITPFWPFGTDIGELWAAATPLARLGSGFGFAFVLTAVTSTPAAALPATLTAPSAILAPGFNGELLFDSRARDVPIRLLCLPTDQGAGFSVSLIEDNVGNSTDDPASWMPIKGTIEPEEWDAGAAYVVGNLTINDDNDTFLCILPHTNHEPPNVTYWLPVTLSDEGSYSAETTYGPGDYVGDKRGVVFVMT